MWLHKKQANPSNTYRRSAGWLTAWWACRGDMDPILARLKKAEAAAYVSIEAAKGWE